MCELRGRMRVLLPVWLGVLLMVSILLSRNLAAQPAAGPFAVGTTPFRVAPACTGLGDAALDGYLLGRPDSEGRPRYVLDLLQQPEASWVAETTVPDTPGVYGRAAGSTLPVAAFIAFPTSPAGERNRYAFPYAGAAYGEFLDMLEPGEAPRIPAKPDRFPLVVYAHGASAHGIYDVRHAQALASHGYIVAVPFYGDDRTAEQGEINEHVAFLRPLLTHALIDSLLDSPVFGPRIEAHRIGVSGHSFGGFTALAVAGAPYQESPDSARHPAVAAAVIAAPWVGGHDDGVETFLFGPGNRSLGQVRVPVLSLFGSRDEITTAASILPAMRQLGGPVYVVELVDQPHIFEQASWQDRDAWELMFFNAYLRNDAEALSELKTLRSMPGGGEDRQHFGYQRVRGGDER